MNCSVSGASMDMFVEKREMGSRHGPTKMDRKIIEKNRRDEMKILYSKLNCLIPNHQKSKEFKSVADQVDEATNYIKKLQENLEKMRKKRDCLVRSQEVGMSINMKNGRIERLESPKLEIHQVGSTLKIVLISGFGHKSMFYDIIQVLHEEGAEVLNANLSRIDDSFVQTIYSEIGDSAFNSRMSRISSRLTEISS